ncbi:MAG: NAD(P)-binding domain-containing protein [Planctomycetota bacterium]
MRSDNHADAPESCLTGHLIEATPEAPVVVVGGGPIGIETAVALQRRGIPVAVVEAGCIGNTISWWAPQTQWFSSNDRIAIAGVPLQTIGQTKATREEYLTYLRCVADQMDVSMRTFTRVVAATESECGFQVQVARGPAWDSPVFGSIAASALVLAIGGTDHSNRLGVPGEDLPHVDGYLREVHRYHGRRVLIIGGRNSAVEAAIRLQRAGAEVTLSYHRTTLPDESIKYWLRPEINGLIQSGRIAAYFGTRVTEITDTDVELETSGSDSQAKRFRHHFDDVLTLIGYRQDSRLFRSLGVQTEGDSGRPIYDPTTMETDRAGIFVAGTAIGGTQSSKYRVFLENCHIHADRIAETLAQRLQSSTTKSSVTAPRSAQQPLQRQIELQPES